MKLFDISLQLKGFPIKKAHAHLKSVQHRGERDFERYVENRKKDITSYHLKQNQFYKQFGSNINLSDWNSVPILTKKELQQPLDFRISKGFKKDSLYVNKTSGSSGDPFIFAKDKFCHALTWAVIKDRFGWYGIDFNTSKQARFYGIPLDKSGMYKERVKDALSNRIRFSIFDLSDECFEDHLKIFEATSFDYINGYTSAIVQFAKYLERREIILKDRCPSLKVCMVTSEMLFPTDRILLMKQFGVPVVNEYGASELDVIAFQNPEGEWQINSETLFVEIIDENGQVLPYGKEGRVVITSLYNKAHPFIRYEIGDVGVISETSTIKKPILKKLTGRTNDVAILPSGRRAAGLTFYYITKSIIEDDGSIKEFVIEQHKTDFFKIIYVSVEDLPRERMKTIKLEMLKYLEKGIEVVFERRQQLTRSKSGKLKQFYSYLNQS